MVLNPLDRLEHVVDAVLQGIQQSNLKFSPREVLSAGLEAARYLKQDDEKLYYGLLAAALIEFTERYKLGRAASFVAKQIIDYSLKEAGLQRVPEEPSAH